MQHSFTPHITVATVVTREFRGHTQYLMVEERCKDSNLLVFNQPAGHVEAHESLVDAACRETLEETAYQVEITALIGHSRYEAANGSTYFRTTFAADLAIYHDDAILDEDIHKVHWLSYAEIIALSARMRSPLVIKSINRHRDGQIYPLSVIY
ncbi:ADP-ribose pyrophosphatase YjhB (NUDIX family) [Sinobacterium caligoides]|uniref:ADP-ribose pyrophosphatase YjhB (NUDIX family) n=1 Tax=Sinobacterium caligoides TaxID=933926 RepID=A0A3N2DXI7_9GAMM|nr:NUDIX domain-containing protein [Sinobacterium caligoides]ROS04570.1 ADP-ribose pyrophosphatase YjhB (NUDIX family) [Sinobacterium caligoides]